MAELNYDINSDSDDEDETTLPSYQQATTWSLDDINQLKDQTSALLDPSWKNLRNKHLLHKMLELEQPTITSKMVEFLMQDTVCDILVGFITQNEHNGERPGPNDAHGEDMRLAYRAVVLLSPEVISDPLNLILSKKAGNIARKLFDIFLPDSGGSFYHAYRVLECLLRCFPAETFDGLCEDGNLPTRMQNMLRFIGFAPVCELAVMLIAFTPVARTSQLCITSSKSRWMFLDNLNTWNIMLHTVLAIVRPSENCECTDSVTADQHSTAASQLFQDLVEKLSFEDSGDLLFLPIAQTPEIMNLLMTTAADSALESCVRQSAAKIVSFLLRRAAESEIVCFVAVAGNSVPMPTYIPNRLHSLREKIVFAARDRIEDIINALRSYDEVQRDNLEPVRYSSYEVRRPFGVLRQLLVEVLVLTVESDETVASMIPIELWTMFVSWILRYAHNNIYHALFYRLVFAVLRQGKEAPQRCLFQKAVFLSFVVDNFIPYKTNDDGTVVINEPVSKDIPNYDVIVRRTVSRGLIMNCANAIRFQAGSEGANSFLVNFVGSHKKWNDFVPLLSVATDVQMKFGMGIRIVILEARGGGNQSIAQLMSEAKPFEDNLDHHTRFAKSLGFFEDAPWSLETPIITDEDPELAEDLSRRLSYLADDENRAISLPPRPPVED